MSLLVPVILLLCSALWLKGLKSVWERALLLAVLLALLFVLLPSISQDRSLVNLAIYQQEARSFAAGIAADIERGDSEGARKRLLYFSQNQQSATANDPDALRSFYKSVELAGQSPAASNSRNGPAPDLE